jgi:circadian clock protein KaiC
MISREFIKTGIPGLDEVLGGGLLKGSTVTLSGPTGSGKSTLAMQFLVNGAQKYSEPGLYISIEDSKASLFFSMSGYSWKIEDLEKSKKLMFLDYPIFEIDQFLNQNSAVLEIINAMGIKRVVIDSIMPLAVYFKDDDERKKGFLKLMINLRKWNTTTLIVAEDTPASTQDVLPSTRYGIETMCEGWIHIYYLYSMKARCRTRAIEALKMKGVKHSTKIHNAKITDDGFKILD